MTQHKSAAIAAANYGYLHLGWTQATAVAFVTDAWLLTPAQIDAARRMTDAEVTELLDHLDVPVAETDAS